MAEEEQKPADMSQESIDYDNKREFRSDQSEGRLSLNDTLQSEYGSEGGPPVSDGSSEQATKRSRSRMSSWNKRTGAQIYHMTENVGERGRNVIKRVKRSVSRPRSMPVDVDTENDPAAENNVMNISIEGSVSSQKKKSGFKEWDKRTGRKMHRFGENIGERVRRSMSRSRAPSSEPSNKENDDDVSAKEVDVSVDLNASVDSSVGKKKKKSGFKQWDKRTGAKIYHMGENITEKSRSAVRSLSKSREPSPGCSTSKDTDSVSATDELDSNVSVDGSVDRKKKKSGFKEWDKRTGAKIHNITASVGERGRDVIKTVGKNISRPASVPTDMDANKDDKISTISKASETSQERKKKNKFTEWNKRTGAQVYNITETASDKVRSGITTAANVTSPAVNKVRSGITTAANSPAVEAATERGRVIVRQATASLKKRTASMPRGTSAPGAEGNFEYSSTLPRHRGGSSSPSRGGTLKRLSANLPPLPPQLRKVFPGREPVHPRDPSPSKPSRRQGPVGKNWVKVYDDISYVDDRDKNNEQDYPKLAHTMGPTVLPNAKPLPTPPTPPPPRARHMNPPAQDLVVDNEIASLYLDGQIETNGRGRNNNRFKGRREKRTGTPIGREFEDEGDALRHSARLDAPQGTDEDDYIIPETLQPEKPIRGIKIYEDVIFKRKQQEQDKHIQQEALEQQIIVADKIEIEEPKKPQRGVKVYEGIIFQQQQEKEKVFLNKSKVSQEMEEEKQPEDISKNNEEVLPSVQKPQRGIKVYEGITFKQQKEKEQEIQEENKSEKIVKEFPAVEDKPAKPQRGIKVYDNFEFKKTEYTFETNMDESVSEVTVDESSTSSEVTIVDGSLKEDVPYKPVRGNKIYASLLVKTHEPSGQVLISEVKETYREEPKLKIQSVYSKPGPTEPVTPRLDELNLELQNSHLSLFEAPTLGVARMDIVKAYETPVVEAQKIDNSIPVTPKVEAEPKREKTDKPKEKGEDKVKVTTKVEEVRKVEVVKHAGVAPIVEITTKVIETADISDSIYKPTDISTEVTKPEVKEDTLDTFIPPYARVHKDTGGVGPLRSLTPVSGDEDGPAPPIPPKLVGIRTITPTASFDIPPRPDRHLKPGHLKPPRGHKQRRPHINGEVLPSRPQRGTKIYADVEPAKPKRHSKIIRIEEVALMKEGLQELIMPPKSTRHPNRQGHEAPPRRRRRSNQENEIEYEDVPEAVTARLTVALDHPAPLEISTDFYENVELKENYPVQNDRSRMRGRPPPPPPPKKGNIQKNYLDRQSDQDSQPSGLSDGHGEVGIPGVVAQGGSGVVDSSIPPPADVRTTSAATAATTGTTSQLETDIDHNLKNIESSFATLDDVLQSLKSYSRESSRNRRVILGESEKERAKLETEVNKRLEAIHSAEVVGAKYQNVEVKSGEVNVVSTASDPILVKKASVSVNDYTEEKSQLIQLPDKIQAKAESKGVQITETSGIKVAITVSENQLLEKSKNVQSEVYLSQKAVVKDVKDEETSEVKVAYAVEETQTSEKTQLLQKSNNIKSHAFIPKTAVAKEVKDEETSEVKVALSVEETQTSEKASEVRCDVIRACAELKDVKDEETEEVKVAVSVQEYQLQEKTTEVSEEIVKAYAELKDVKDEETEEVKVAVTVVELQTQEKTSEVKAGEIFKEKAILTEEEIIEEGPVLITEICSVVTPPKAVHEPVPDKTLSLADFIAEDKNVASVEEVTAKFELIKITVSGEESKQVEDSVTIQTSSDEVNSRAEAVKTQGEQQTNLSDNKASEDQSGEDLTETAILQAGVADIASRLEGIRCALESVIVNYPPPSPTPSTPPPSILPVNTSTTSPVPPPPHSTPIQSPATPSIDTVHTTTDTITTNLRVHSNTTLCPSSPTFPRASSPHTTTSYIPYIHSIAASIQSTAGSLQYEGYESPVSSPEPPHSPASPVIYHSSSVHALEALDKSFKTFNDALEALEDPSLLDDDTPTTDSYKPPSILHLLSSSPSKASVTTVQSSDKNLTPTDKIQESTISKSVATDYASSSKFLTETSITDKLISDLQVKQFHIKDSSLQTSSDNTVQDISPQITLSNKLLVQQPRFETPLLENPPKLQTSVEELINSSVQTQQAQVKQSPLTQSHVKQPSLEQPQSQHNKVEPSTAQSTIKQTLLESSQIQQISEQDLPITQQPTLKKSTSTSRFGLTVSPSSDNLLPWEYMGPAKSPSPTETPRGRSPLLSPKQPAPRSKSPVFGFTKVDPDSDNIPWQYLGPVTSSSILTDPKLPSSSHDYLQGSSISAVVTSSSSSSITESKSSVESSSSIPIPSRDSSLVTVHSHINRETLRSPFPSSPPRPTARFTFGLPSVNPGVVPSGNPSSCTSNIQDLQSATGQLRDSSSTTLEDSSAASATQQNQTGGCVELTIDSNCTSCSDLSLTLPPPHPM